MKIYRSLILPILCLLLTSCGKEVPDGSSVSDNSAEKIARATQTLRLGQTTSSNTAIAVSAAIDNFESFTSLGRDRIEHVLYTTSDGSVVRVSLDELLRPSSAQTKDTIITFSNYTSTTVDVSSNGATTSIPLASAGNLKSTSIPSSSLKAVAVLPISERLDVSARAIRSFGCFANQAASQLPVGGRFSSISLSSCRSLLVDAVRVRLDRKEADLIPVSRELAEPRACDNDQSGWIDDFSRAQSCAARVGTQLIKEVLKENPTVDSEIDPDFTPEDNFDDEFEGDFDDGIDDDGNFIDDDDDFIDDDDDIIDDDDGIIDGEDPDTEEPTDPVDGGEDPDSGEVDEETPPELPEPPLPGEPQPGTPG